MMVEQRVEIQGNIIDRPPLEFSNFVWQLEQGQRSLVVAVHGVTKSRTWAHVHTVISELKVVYKDTTDKSKWNFKNVRVTHSMAEKVKVENWTTEGKINSKMAGLSPIVSVILNIIYLIPVKTFTQWVEKNHDPTIYYWQMYFKCRAISWFKVSVERKVSPVNNQNKAEWLFISVDFRGMKIL